jgi:sporulation protein YlmC with PRC-barrel domain
LTSRIILAIALSTVSGFALAQGPAPKAQTNVPAATAQTTGMNADKGLRIANSATMAVKFVTVQPADFMSSKLVGANVYNNQNESLGEIEDLVIDNGKTITGVVVSVGGFLGMGESYVVLDPSTVVLNEKDGKWRAFVDTSKDNLKNAPKFKYTKAKS